MKRFARPVAGALLLCAAAAGCGDPETTDRRGYTKAPLEKPFVLIGGQDRSAMDELGEPNRVEPREIELAEEPADTAGD